MSLFDPIPEAESARCTRIANDIVTDGNRLFELLLTRWAVGISSVWDDSNSQGVIDAMGGNAVALFTRAGQLQAFLESQKPGCTAFAAVKVRPFTANQDGTITINP